MKQKSTLGRIGLDDIKFKSVDLDSQIEPTPLVKYESPKERFYKHVVESTSSRYLNLRHPEKITEPPRPTKGRAETFYTYKEEPPRSKIMKKNKIEELIKNSKQLKLSVFIENEMKNTGKLLE